jgi:hypothetical protein
MRAKPVLITLLALAAIVGVSLLAYRWEAPERPALCQVCGRVIPQETAFRLDTAKGTMDACCPGCAMHYMLHHPGTVRNALATDFTSGRTIPAAMAFYDEGGDVQYCTLHQPPVERGPRGVSQRVYDRCLPVLVAFATRHEAEAYRRQHGGRVVTYDEALASLRGE